MPEEPSPGAAIAAPGVLLLPFVPATIVAGTKGFGVDPEPDPFPEPPPTPGIPRSEEHTSEL